MHRAKEAEKDSKSGAVSRSENSSHDNKINDALYEQSKNAEHFAARPQCESRVGSSVILLTDLRAEYRAQEPPDNTAS